MGLILLEAFAALAALVLIVWWTMFSGRRRGEIDHTDAPPQPGASSQPGQAAGRDGDSDTAPPHG